MKKIMLGIVIMLGLFSVSFGAYSTTPSNEFFICDTICPSVAYSFSHTDKKIVADLANYQLNFSNTVLNLLRETDLYKKMKKEYKQDPQLSKPSWIGSDDPVLWDPNFNILKQSAKLTVEQVAKKIGITNQDSIDHIKNINLLTMYYNSLGGPYGGRDYVYARSLTTGAVKSLDRYKKTYDNTTVYIDNSHYRKKQPIFIYKGKNIYYSPIAVCTYNEKNDQHNCELYGVTKQIISGKIKQISSKLLGKFTEQGGEAGKPVIYFYPDKPTDITAKLDLKGDFSITYPQISRDNTRSITAQPDGTLIDKKDGKEYSYIFREANKMKHWKIDEGFVVQKKDYASFLQEKLTYLGLIPGEYNEFIVYRLPLMNQYPYVSLKFAGKEYTDQAPLTITPKPDSIQRVFMIFQGLDKKIDLPEQQLTPFKRSGFSVIERGGTEIHN